MKTNWKTTVSAAAFVAMLSTALMGCMAAEPAAGEESPIEAAERDLSAYQPFIELVHETAERDEVEEVIVHTNGMVWTTRMKRVNPVGLISSRFSWLLPAQVTELKRLVRNEMQWPVPVQRVVSNDCAPRTDARLSYRHPDATDNVGFRVVYQYGPGYLTSPATADTARVLDFLAQFEATAVRLNVCP